MKPDRRAFLSLSLGGMAFASQALPVRATQRGAEALDQDLARLRQVDPALIGYDEVDRIALDLAEPRGLACGQAGRLWVVGDRQLALFVGGRDARRVVLPSSPSCVCESVDGERVYLALGDQIEVRGIDGTRLAVWRTRGENALITSLAASERFLFVADAVRRTVQRLDTEGHELGRIGGADGSPAHFVVPSPYLDLALTGDGVLWVTNPGRHRVESYTLDGRALGAIEASGASIERFCGCCNPTHIAALPDGRLVTSEKGLPRVKVLRPNGELDCVVAAGDRLAAGVAGLDLAVDQAGRVLVLDPKSRAVRAFAARPRGGARG